jgi:hypothetical protein
LKPETHRLLASLQLGVAVGVSAAVPGYGVLGTTIDLGETAGAPVRDKDAYARAPASDPDLVGQRTDVPEPRHEPHVAAALHVIAVT